MSKDNSYNIIMDADSYKLGHFNQYPTNTEGVYSYFESRNGSQWNKVKFFGLQYILKTYLEGTVVTKEMVEEAEALAKAHFMGVAGTFNKEGWMYIVNKHKGKLPIRIKAVPEGMVIPISNVLMTVENTDPKCFWLTNFVETLLSRIWYTCTVATKSMVVREIIEQYWEETTDGGKNDFGVNFCLHDFGSRGVSSYESAGVGGMAHLTNFMGTDTVHSMMFANKFYKANLNSIAYSVPATEHSVMVARGRNGEEAVFEQLLDNYPTGILSVVIDSYDPYNFTTKIATKYKDRILTRDGKLVFRPDSGNPITTTLEILENLGNVFGYTLNAKGFKVLNPKVGVIWGDGIDTDGIEQILANMKLAKYAASNIVFGMGGGLLQKVNRDTMRFAFKASAINQDGVWHDVFKDPITAQKDSGMFKGSKRGKLALVKDTTSGRFNTVQTNKPFYGELEDLLQVVFENGELVKEYTWDEVKANGKA